MRLARQATAGAAATLAVDILCLVERPEKPYFIMQWLHSPSVGAALSQHQARLSQLLALKSNTMARHALQRHPCGRSAPANSTDAAAICCLSGMVRLGRLLAHNSTARQALQRHAARAAPQTVAQTRLQVAQPLTLQQQPPAVMMPHHHGEASLTAAASPAVQCAVFPPGNAWAQTQ